MVIKYLTAAIISVAVLLGAQAHADPDSPPRYRWSAQEAGIGTGSFSQASGLELETQPVEYRGSQARSSVSKMNGLSKYGNTHFKRPGQTEPANPQYFFEYVKQTDEPAEPHYTPYLRRFAGRQD